MICKICKIDKLKQHITKGDHVRFIDELNRVWNGKVCPDCYKIYNKQRMRKSRADKKLNKCIKS